MDGIIYAIHVVFIHQVVKISEILAEMSPVTMPISLVKTMVGQGGLGDAL
jgi:acetyl-CoA carboxylase alpha subunit